METSKGHFEHSGKVGSESPFLDRPAQVKIRSLFSFIKFDDKLQKNLL